VSVIRIKPLHCLDKVNQKHPHPILRDESAKFRSRGTTLFRCKNSHIALHFARDLRLRESTTDENFLMFTARLRREFHNHVCQRSQSRAADSLKTCTFLRSCGLSSSLPLIGKYTISQVKTLYIGSSLYVKYHFSNLKTLLNPCDTLKSIYNISTL
jgi:hypothetical protein